MSHALTETRTYAASITIPDDGEDALEASVETPFGQLASRCNYLLDNAVTAPAPITFVRTVPLSRARPVGSVAWQIFHTAGVASWGVLSAATAFTLLYSFKIPDGAVIVGFRAGVRINGGSPSAGMAMAAYLMTPDKTGVAGASTAAQLGSTQTSTTSTSAQNPLAITGLSQPYAADTQDIEVAIHASDSGSGLFIDEVLWLEVTYTHTDPKAGLVSL